MHEPDRTRWGEVVLLIVAGIVAAFQLGKVPVALPLLRTEFGLDAVVASAFLSALTLLGAFGGLVFGALADRLGHRRMLAGGLGLLALASIGGAFAHDAALVLAGRVAEGVGYLAVAVAVPPLIVAATDARDRRAALGWWGTYVPLGMAAVLFTAPPLLHAGGWRALWLATGAAALLAALVIVPRLSRVSRERGAPLGARIGAVVATPMPSVLALAFAAYAGEYLALVGFLPTLIVASGLTVAIAAIWSGVVTLASAAGNLLGGFLARAVPRWATITGGALVMGGSAALAFDHAAPLWLRIAASTLATFAGGVIPSSIMASVPIVAPSPKLIASTQGLAVQGSCAGQVIVPVVVAAVGGLRPGPNGSLTMLAFSAITIAAALVLRARERHVSP
jgi:predicted MFS family arabinose efflux permease